MEMTRRHRSPSYPGINLKEAIERGRVFFSKEGKHKATISTAATHWGYSESSSTRLTTIAALKSYGLMVDSGEGVNRMVSLSPLGLAIIQDSRSVSPEREEHIRKAALQPKTMADLWAKYGTDLPSDDTLAHYLKVDREFNPNSVADVIRIYKENAEFAALGGIENEDGNNDDGTGEETDNNGPTEQAIRAREVGSPPPAITPPSPSSRKATEEEIANIRVARDCTIRLLASGAYSKKSIEALVAQLKLGLDLGTYDDDINEGNAE